MAEPWSAPGPDRPACVVGIAGGSASGKSRLAAYLKRELGSRASLLCQDWYYRDYGHLPPEECLALNFDHPDSIETPLFVSHVDRLLDGLPVQAPRYDYATHSRLRETVAVEPAQVLILEGLFVLHEPAVLSRLDISVYIEVSDEVRLERRLRRDGSERRVDPAETLRLYESCVRPMYERYIAPSGSRADLLWRQLEDGDRFPEVLLERVRARLGRAAAPAAGLSLTPA